MTEKLTCPVCDRTEIETNICPNCEADLSTIRMLKQLPILENKSSNKKWLISLLLILLFIGILVGSYSGYLIAKNNYSASLEALQKQANQEVSNVDNVEETKPKLNWCGGFNYRIKSGDSLYMLALRFYGDGTAWHLITEANPNITSPQNLEIGQIILIPNLTEFCQ
ncbi:LysM peptidoglycan-binding domain-containing protein [Geminocystis sp. CENA526]|uniref:LysM peptidoglycan-binding domain-containing protein n=1 Tax=Geminocystis sp. CENA526 TaxID=1355871 RepID=UPI003D6F6E6A